jgi:hypothetical protein
LQLLPSNAYGNHWLRVTHDEKTVLSLPQKGDPYEEIYKVPDKWYGLLREEWLNPASQPGRGFARSCALLDEAKSFHQNINSTYHPQSYAHYGADPDQPSWQHVEWKLGIECSHAEANDLQILEDNRRGILKVRIPSRKIGSRFEVKLGPSFGAGDQTVPLHSAEHQLHSGKFRGIFRQLAYEHQGSYQDENAVDSTLYSLVRIASTMRWSDE